MHPQTPPGTKDFRPSRLRVSREERVRPMRQDHAQAVGSKREAGSTAGHGPGESRPWPTQEGSRAGQTRGALAGGAAGPLTEKLTFPQARASGGGSLPQVTPFEPWKWARTASFCGPDSQGLDGLSDLPNITGLVSPEAEDGPSSC